MLVLANSISVTEAKKEVLVNAKRGKIDEISETTETGKNGKNGKNRDKNENLRTNFAQIIYLIFHHLLEAICVCAS